MVFMLETYLQDVGCILYADDIILLSCSYYGMQKMVNICSVYGIQWDIKFNSMKSQCITCLLYTSPSPRDRQKSRMPSSA